MAATRNSLLAAAAAVVVMPLAWMIGTRRPVLFTFARTPYMNPFRDRAPERVAERCLAEVAMGRLDCTGNDARTVEHEERWPLRSWRLGSREDTPTGSELMYWVTRGKGVGLEPPVMLQVTGSGSDARVTYYFAVY